MFPDARLMVQQRIEMMPNPPVCVEDLPVDFTERLPIVQVIDGAGNGDSAERVERVVVDVWGYYPPEGTESAKALIARITEWLCDEYQIFQTDEGFADAVVCDPTPTRVAQGVDDLDYYTATFVLTVRSQ